MALQNQVWEQRFSIFLKRPVSPMSFGPQDPNNDLETVAVCLHPQGFLGWDQSPWRAGNYNQAQSLWGPTTLHTNPRTAKHQCSISNPMKVVSVRNTIPKGLSSNQAREASCSPAVTAFQMAYKHLCSPKVIFSLKPKCLESVLSYPQPAMGE